jgi:signal transduction histidine kinase
VLEDGATVGYRGPDRRVRTAAPGRVGMMSLAVAAAVIVPFGVWSLAVAAALADGVLPTSTLCTIAASALAATSGALVWRFQWAGDVRSLWCSAAVAALGVSAVAAAELLPTPRGGWGIVHATSLVVATWCLLRAVLDDDVDVDRTAAHTLLGPAVVVASSLLLTAVVPQDTSERASLAALVVVAVVLCVVASFAVAARGGSELQHVVPFVAVASGWVGVGARIDRWGPIVAGVVVASSLIRLSGAAIALYGAILGLRAAWAVAHLRGRGAASTGGHLHPTRVHDTRNVLAGLEGATLLLAREAGAERPDEVGRLAEVMRVELDRLGSMLEPDGRETEASCDAVEVCSAQAVLVEARGVAVELSAPTAAHVAAPAGDVARVVQNLLLNATVHGRAREHGCRLEIRSEGDQVLICVEDRGPGLSTRRARQILNGPVQSRRGRGLGLHGAVGLARANGGQLRYEAAASGGARFCLRLPVAATERAGVVARRAGDAGSGGVADPHPEASAT